MSAQSQRPLVNKLLACDPLRINGTEYTSIDDALLAVGKGFGIEDLAKALDAHDVPVSIWQLWRWKKETLKAAPKTADKWS